MNYQENGEWKKSDCNSVADPDGDRLINLQETEYGTNPNDDDTDDDALTDFAELFGGHFGQIDFVDLPGLGADPFHKDIFVEIDYYTNYGPGSVSLRPNDQALTNVIAAFTNAPTSNPDGLTGINLHLIVDDGIDTALYPTNILDLSPETNFTSEANLLKNNHFEPGREDYFRWCLYADKYYAGSSAGISVTIPSDMLVIALGPTHHSTNRTVHYEGLILMHELGHSLGLRHGGTNDVSYSPNYLSIMNPSYSTSGQPLGLKVNGITNVLDYSRLEIASVDEQALNEVSGFSPISPTTETNLQAYGVYIPYKGWIDTTNGASAKLDFNLIDLCIIQ